MMKIPLFGKALLFSLIGMPLAFGQSIGRSAPDSSYTQGVSLYKAGRYSEATEAFENAAKRRDHEEDARRYIERIRKETVERIRNKALSGVAKTNWQTKYYFINNVEGRIRAGLSVQELFDPYSLNFRPGALDALAQLADILRRSDNSVVTIEIINEMPQARPSDPETMHQQVAAVFCFLEQVSRNPTPKL